MLKISLSGLPGSGVNALLTETRKILGLKYNVEVVEPVRVKNPFDNSSHSGFISCFFDVSTQINDESTRSISNPDLLACNRSALDHWVFWNRELNNKTRTPQLDEKHELIRHMVSYWMPSYDRFFLLRLDLRVLRERLGPVSAGEYSLDELNTLEEFYQRSIKELGIQVIEIWNNGSIDETAQKMVAALSDAIPKS